jgi:hypothetical protein
VGAFAVAIVLIPLLGIYRTCFLLIILKALIASALLVRMRKRV